MSSNYLALLPLRGGVSLNLGFPCACLWLLERGRNDAVWLLMLVLKIPAASAPLAMCPLENQLPHEKSDYVEIAWLWGSSIATWRSIKVPDWRWSLLGPSSPAKPQAERSQVSHPGKYCMEQKNHPANPCPNSWPTDWKQIKRSWVYATKIWSSLFHKKLYTNLHFINEDTDLERK